MDTSTEKKMEATREQQASAGDSTTGSSNVPTDRDESSHLNSLPPGFQLRNWVIERELGAGGFEITYLVRHDGDDSRLAVVREYLPIGIAVRSANMGVELVLPSDKPIFDFGRTRFIEQAQALARIEHPNVVHTTDFFELGNTAYAVMEYVPGPTLADQVAAEGPVKDRDLARLMNALIGGLGAIHAEILHHAITPSNIILRPDGEPVLVDIGAAREATRVFDMEDTGGPRLSIVYHAGYVPIEQIDGSANGPWTDIYALGACFYYAAFADAPIDIAVRSEGLQGDETQPGRDLLVSPLRRGESDYSPDVLSAIEHALRFDPERRPATASEWLAHLSSVETAEVGADTLQSKQAIDGEAPERRGGKSGWWSVTAVAAIAAVAFAGWKVLGPGNESKFTAVPQPGERIEAPDVKADEEAKAAEEAQAAAEAKAAEEAQAAAEARAAEEAQADAEAKAAEEAQAAAEARAAEEAQAAAEAKAAEEAQAAAEARAAEEAQAAAEAKAAEEAQAAAEARAAEEAQAAAEARAAEEAQAAAEARAAEEAQAAAEARAAEEAQAAASQEAKKTLLLQQARSQLLEGVESEAGLSSAAELYKELLQVDPDDSVANLGARIVSQLSDVRAGLETADVQRSMSGLDQTYPLWEKMGFSRQELEPLLVQTLVLQFLDSVEPVSVMTEESVIVAREPLSLLQSTAMNQEHLAAAERALNQLVVVENNFRESRFEPIPELLASVEQDLSSFADRPVELSAARNHFVIESSRAKLRKNEEFSQSLALANEKLAIRPIDIEMIRDARQAFVALKETRPDRALTVQVIDNLQHIETALTRLAENDVAGASQAVANIELLAGATDAEGALLSEIEATITSARVTYHIDQLGVALANPPLDSTRLQQARSSFDRAVDANGNSEAVRGASLLLQDLDAVVKNIDEINPDEAQFALDRAIGRLTTLGFDKTVLAHVDQQIQASHQALDKQKLDEKVDELLNTAQRRIEANPDDQAAIDQSYRDSNKILLELDSTNAKAGDLLQLVTLLNDSIIAHQELRNDDALEYLTKSKPVFRKLDMNDAALDGLMAKIQSQQDYNVDVEIDKLFDSWLENIRVNPFDAKILDQATTDMTRLAALRPGDKVVLLASEITGHLRKADESIDSGEFVEARLNLARARDAFSTLDIGDGWLNKAYEELERIQAAQ